jgi:IS1 family transposase/transposase-like protein
MSTPQCTECQSASTRKYGHTPDGRSRTKCRDCGRVWVETKLPKPARRARRIPAEQAERILGLLCEGASIRAIQRLTGAEQRTILRLLVDLGAGCERLLEEKVNGVSVNDVECDETWTFLTCKEAVRRKKQLDPEVAGDRYCWLAVERGSKLLLAHHVGRRTSTDAHIFMARLAAATAGRFQLSTDGYDGYPGAIEEHLGARVDYAQQIKEFGNVGGEEGRRYAPPKLLKTQKFWISGTPDEERVGTSRIERFNWTLRTGLRRFVRLSNGFSRKHENLAAAVAIFVCYYNFVKYHKSLRMPPAVKAGLVRAPWTLADLLREAEQRAHGPMTKAA